MVCQCSSKRCCLPSHQRPLLWGSWNHMRREHSDICVCNPDLHTRGESAEIPSNKDHQWLTIRLLPRGGSNEGRLYEALGEFARPNSDAAVPPSSRRRQPSCTHHRQPPQAETDLQHRRKISNVDDDGHGSLPLREPSPSWRAVQLSSHAPSHGSIRDLSVGIKRASFVHLRCTNNGPCEAKPCADRELHKAQYCWGSAHHHLPHPYVPRSVILLPPRHWDEGGSSFSPRWRQHSHWGSWNLPSGHKLVGNWASCVCSSQHTSRGRSLPLGLRERHRLGVECFPVDGHWSQNQMLTAKLVCLVVELLRRPSFLACALGRQACILPGVFTYEACCHCLWSWDPVGSQTIIGYVVSYSVSANNCFLPWLGEWEAKTCCK